MLVPPVKAPAIQGGIWPPAAKCQIKHWGLGLHRPSKLYSFISPSSGERYYTFTQSINSLVCAVKYRVFNRKLPSGDWAPPPLPQEGVFSTKFFSSFRKEVIRHVGDVTPYTWEEFLGTYEGKQRRMYEPHVLEARTRGVQQKHSHIRPFIKVEPHCKQQAVPRLISPRHPVYNAAVGRYLKKIEKPIYRAIDALFRRKFKQARCVFKGSDSFRLGRDFEKLRHRFSRPVFVGLDAERFDQHVSQVALKYEHSFYNRIFKDAKLAHWLTWQLETKCKAFANDGYIRWRSRGGRMSGDMNTSLGNTLLMCAMIYAYLCEHGIDAALANNGDDCVLVLEQRDLHKLSTIKPWFTDRGFTMAVEKPVHELEQAEFCQSHCLNIGGSWQFVRKHNVVTSKDLCTSIHLDTVDKARAWASAVAQCGIATTAGVPVQGAFYKRLFECNLDYRKSGATESIISEVIRRQKYRMLDKHPEVATTEITPEARASYYFAFGVTPPEQRVIERNLEFVDLTITQTPSKIELQHLFEVDRSTLDIVLHSVSRESLWLRA